MRTTSRALAFATRWFDPETVERVFAPLIADWQREWQDATGARRWLVHLRAFAAFCSATVLSSYRIVRESTPPAVSNRIVTRISRFALVVTSLNMVAYVWQLNVSPAAMLLLVPSTLVIAFPFAMISAVDAIRRDHSLPPHVERATVAKLAVAAVAFMIVFGGFVVPAANQAFRASTYRQALRAENPEWAARVVRSGQHVPRRGLRELSTYELLTDHGFRDGTRFLPAQVNKELSVRASLAVLPLVLLWLRWSLLDRPKGRWSPLPAPVVAVGALIAFGLPWQNTVIGGWLPILVVCTILFLDSWRRSRRRALA